MSNEIINQMPTLGRAKELEQQAKEGLTQLKMGQDKAIIACHTMRDTSAYTVLGFDSYYAWGESTLNLKKSRLNELALAGEVQLELLTGMTNHLKTLETADIHENIGSAEKLVHSIAPLDANLETEKVNTIDTANSLVATPANPFFTTSALAEISTPQLVALAKAPKGERFAILDKVAVVAKAEDKPVTTSIIKEVVKASAAPVESSIDEQAVAIKKSHRSAMNLANNLGGALKELNTEHVNSKELESWQVYLDDIKESISAFEQKLGYK